MATIEASTPQIAINHPTQIIVSVDLKQAILDHLSYLREYYSHPECLQKQAREYAIYRYEVFWLPLLAENTEVGIVPPLDVHFVWHTHMLSPIAYATDCERIFGRILPSRVRERSAQILKLSEQIWAKKYSRTMPFDLNYNTNIQVIPPYSSKIKYSLSLAIERQAEFFYNVSLGHFKDPTFLDEAMKRYKKLLYLKRINPQLHIVPMYDIDLVWHTHQLFPDVYRQDMMINLQQILHHDELSNDRTNNAKLSAADQETRHKWFELYGDRLPKNGCMYRGKSSKGFYQQLPDFNFLLECQRYTIYVQFVEHHSATAKRSTDEKGNIVVPLHDQEATRDQLFAQFNSSEQELFLRAASGNIEAHFEADFNDFSAQLVLKIQQKAGIWPMNYFSSLLEFPIPMDKTNLISQFNQPVQASNHVSEEEDPTALYHLLEQPIDDKSPLHALVPSATKIIAGVPALDVNTIIVRFEGAEYETITLDANYPALLGTTFLFNLENVQVKQAQHIIQPLHQDDPILFNIRHTLLNDIHVFTANFGGAIFASCHTMNWSQLPLPDQVSSNADLSAITLNPEIEEALIIKDHNGDWGIVKYNQDLFTASLEDDKNEKNFQFILYRFTPDGRTEEEIIYVDWEDEKWLIGSKNFSIDMNTWSISVKRVEIKNSAQYICLGASLITRFDVLFNEIFGKSDEASESSATNDENQLATGLAATKLNGSKVKVDNSSNIRSSHV